MFVNKVSKILYYLDIIVIVNEIYVNIFIKKLKKWNY